MQQWLVSIDPAYAKLSYRHKGFLRTVLPGCVNRLDPEHSFVVLYGKDKRGVEFLEIQLSRHVAGEAKVLLQSGIVTLLGSAAGPYEFWLSVDEPIYPMARTLNAILNAGVAPWKISPVSDDMLTTRPLRGGFVGSEHVRTDGEVSSCDPGLWAASARCTITEATWAVMSNEGVVADVYIWGDTTFWGRFRLLRAIAKASRSRGWLSSLCSGRWVN